MKCEICNKGPMDGITLHRVNEYGVKGIWRCKAHLTFDQDAAIDLMVKRIVDIIEDDNRRKNNA